MATDDRETLPPIQTSVPEAWLPEPRDAEDSGPEHRRYADRYEELGFLGEGGMGRVLRVLDRELNRVVAMKVLRSALHGAEAQVRFLNEAQVGAQLEHPGILPVYDIGRRPDGGLYFTMREIQGSTLSSVIRASHSGGGWGQHRLIDAFHRVCEAMAYAHSRGVTHRDLKPDNIMAGSFGQILVLDWGLARVAASAEEPLWTQRSEDSTAATRYGVVMGTRHFMPPEQLRGDTQRIGPPADVYALGAILFQIIFGEPPPLGSGGEILSFSQQLSRVRHREAPDGLLDIAEDALALVPEDRPTSAQQLAERVGGWLEGRERSARGMRLVERASEQGQRAEAMREEAARLRAEATSKRSREAIWALEDAAEALERESGIAAARRLQALQGALTHDPNLTVAHEELARHYQALQEQAEVAGDLDAASRHEVFLRHHDRGAFAEWLIGDGTVSLVCDPPEARVALARLEVKGRRLVPVPLSAHTAPLHLSLPRGSYQLTLSAPGCHEVRYPVAIGRCEHWDGVRPGDTAPTPVRLPRLGELSEQECYIPPGWFRAGGEIPDVANNLPPQRVWVDGFIMRRHPVTSAEFAVFLDDLLSSGRRDEAERWVPRWTAGDLAGQPVFELRPGAVMLCPDADGDVWDSQWPVFMVDWMAARAYAGWLGQREGVPWRLPLELEWEKAARGVDGRTMPWGDFLDPRWCRMSQTPGHPPGPARISAFPTDVGPFGVRGMAGNVLDWCLNRVPELPAIRADGLLLEVAVEGEDGRRALRGGAWDDVGHRCRLDRRRGMGPRLRNNRVGFRLARTLS